MPWRGLSLVGFLDQALALNHLEFGCVPAISNPPQGVLIAEWQQAVARLGAPIPNAGNPTIQPLPAAANAHIQALLNVPWATQYLNNLVANGAQFASVSIDELLAFQLIVNQERSETHCNQLARPPTLSELLNLCLPLGQDPYEFAHSDVTQHSSSVLLRGANTNMHVPHWGIYDVNMNGVNVKIVGAQVVMRLPFVQVVRFNGRYYLHNGFHRTYGARLAGADAVPCIVRDVNSVEEIGIGPQTFQLPLLEGGDPPTVGHFTQGRAHPVSLRKASRMVHVAWHEYTMPDE